jgi:glutamyl-tRNA reductase
MRFQQALRNLDMGPTLGAVRRKMHEIADAEMERQRPRLGNLTPEQERAVHDLLVSTVNKISHPIMGGVRRSYDSGQEENVRAWREVFGLDEDFSEQVAETGDGED